MARTNHSEGTVYNSRPYHAPYVSDDEGEDDDVCVWKDVPELSDYYDTDEEPLLVTQLKKANVKPKLKKANDRVKTTPGPKIPSDTTTSTGGQTEAGSILPSNIDPETGKLTNEAFREREVQYALSTARRNLTHASQFLLKLEARAGKTTKEGIRQTLDATVKDMNYDFGTCGSDGGPPDADHKSEIEEINQLSKELYNRLYLVDRHWRRIARETRDDQGRSPNITILSEGEVKEWIKVEIQTNHLTVEETCFFTVQDLQANRSLWDWATHLQEICKFSDHPTDEFKLVQLAWRFLDRNLRGPRPLNPTSLEKFISDLNATRASGAWDKIRKNPRKQEQDDAEAWKAMKKYWSSRIAPM
ncbi:hypothetical protein F5B17DRAFT_448725 [Nemania serpens]|nr:hypothetical protein F5B17DRAFT_448725 [Nemania serpens]